MISIYLIRIISKYIQLLKRLGGGLRACWWPAWWAGLTPQTGRGGMPGWANGLGYRQRPPPPPRPAPKMDTNKAIWPGTEQTTPNRHQKSVGREKV